MPAGNYSGPAVRWPTLASLSAAELGRGRAGALTCWDWFYSGRGRNNAAAAPRRRWCPTCPMGSAAAQAHEPLIGRCLTLDSRAARGPVRGRPRSSPLKGPGQTRGGRSRGGEESSSGQQRRAIPISQRPMPLQTMKCTPGIDEQKTRPWPVAPMEPWPQWKQSITRPLGPGGPPTPLPCCSFVLLLQALAYKGD
ncbi:hypothetical protein GGR56DRAFT_192867 [Xylariaceae sp. FL0804]|nr:hypothetical protein GGR56DRAFT_192867 [Xylariaceae sp. FL0804]